MKENLNSSHEGKTHAFPCASCGNQMIFDPEHGDMSCPYCKTHEPIPSNVIEAPEYIYFPDGDEYEAPDWASEGSRSFVCPSCGAETTVSAEDVTASCPFCGNNYVTELSSDKKIISPETLLPFRIGKDTANGRFSIWAKKRYLAPRDFRNAKNKISLSGIYVPFWTFDSHLETDYSGQGGRDRTVHYTVRVNGKTQHRTKVVTDWYQIRGHEALEFDDIPVCASHGIDRATLKKLGAFSMKMLNVYNPAYLSGFFAERYSIGLKEGFDGIRADMERRMEEHIKRERGFDRYRFMEYSHRYSNVRFKHILLPVWLAAYKYKNRTYNIMINGETGIIAGKYPLSAIKIALIVLGAMGVFALIILFTLMLGNGGGYNGEIYI